MSPVRPLPSQTLPMGLICFCFLEVLAKLQTIMAKKQKYRPPPDLAHGSELFVFFCFLEILIKLQKTMAKNKLKKTKNSEPCPQPGLSPDLAHGSELFGFLFFWFSRDFAQTAKNHEKKQKNKKNQTHVPSQASPQTLPMGVNFFLGFFEILAKLQKTWKKNQQKIQTHVPSQASPRPCPNLNFFVFFGFSRFWSNYKTLWKKTKKIKKSKKKIRPMSPTRPLPRPCQWVWFFFGFLEILAKLQKTMEKPEKQKKTKNSDPYPQPGLSPDLAHGSIFFCFFFHIFFAYFLCKYVFILISLKKYVLLQFTYLRPPDQITKKTWKIKLHLITYIIIINMIIIYIYRFIY